MAETSPQASLHVAPATLEDLPELCTVFARSFHPVSPYMRQAIPDTALVRSWWDTTNTAALQDPEVRFWKAVDSKTGQIVAICRWRLSRDGLLNRHEAAHGMNSNESNDALDAGLWSRIPLSKDHDELLCRSFIDYMAEQRTAFMRGRRHILIELLGAVHEHKGRGAGKMLVESLMEEGIKEQAPIFVESNMQVKGFYLKLGFAIHKEEDMPGGEYREYIMIKEPR